MQHKCAISWLETFLIILLLHSDFAHMLFFIAGSSKWSVTRVRIRIWNTLIIERKYARNEHFPVHEIDVL